MLPLVVCLLNIKEINGFTGTWSVTTYQSYAPCCPSNPNYNANADKSECNDYSACYYPGEFAAFENTVSYEYVRIHNLVALKVIIYHISMQYNIKRKQIYISII